MARQLSDQELIRRAVDGRLLDVRTSMAGEVVSFDANTMTATVRPAVRVQAVDSDSRPEVDELPDLEDVPVLYPSAGGFLLYIPLSAGDPVRIEFSEEDDSEFYDDASADVPGNPINLKRHGGAYVCRPEGFRGTGALGGESDSAPFIGTPDGVGIKFDSGTLVIGDSSATNFVALANLVKSELQDMNTAIGNHTHASPAGGFTGTALASTPAYSHTVGDVAAAKVKAK